jgi:hypothetical protein
MNVRLTNIVVPRSTFISRDNKRYNNSDGRSYNTGGRRYDNQRQNRLKNGDQRKVSFNSPKVATMTVGE